MGRVIVQYGLLGEETRKKGRVVLFTVDGTGVEGELMLGREKPSAVVCFILVVNTRNAKQKAKGVDTPSIASQSVSVRT